MNEIQKQILRSVFFSIYGISCRADCCYAKY